MEWFTSLPFAAAPSPEEPPDPWTGRVVDETAELAAILEKTSHVPPEYLGVACGSHATSSLRKLDDGQTDDIVTLRRRRKAEDEYYAEVTNRKPWDSSVWHYTPAALKDLKPVTPEPWARCARPTARRRSIRPIPARISMLGSVEHNGRRVAQG